MNEEQEVSVGVVSYDQQLLVQFSDGQYAIPQHALDVLGGKDNLIKIVPDFRHKTFGEFLSAVHLIGEKHVLNWIQRTTVANHLQNNSRTQKIYQRYTAPR